MTNYSEQINLPYDNDGYTMFQCPHCREYFRLNNNELEEENINELFCPICGLSSSVDNFTTDKIINHAKLVAENMAIDVINKSMKDMARKSKGVFKVTNTLKKKPVPKIYENDDEMIIKHFRCCTKSAKILLIDEDIAYCPYCGVN